jgi:AraC-like DNA-binding protein
VLSAALLVENNSGTWPVPSGCAAWIPARTRHSITATPTARVRTLYIWSGPHIRSGPFADQTAVLELSPLLRALGDHIHRHGANKNLVAVLIDQLSAQRELPLFLPALSSPIAQRVANVLASDPGGTPRIRDLAAELGVSDRTLERAFVADAGMTLGEWRQRARIGRAIALLAGGMEVKDVALEVGYETPSAFVVAFKKHVGTTPGKTKHEEHEAHEGT